MFQLNDSLLKHTIVNLSATSHYGGKRGCLAGHGSNIRLRDSTNQLHVHRKKIFRIVAENSSTTESTPSSGSIKKVVIIGGSGRIGKSTAISLSRLFSAGDSSESGNSRLEIVIGGRDRGKGEEAIKDIGSGASFFQCDIDKIESLEQILNGADLVVHSAGPFQRKEHCNVLEAAIRTKTAYIDVCDDLEYSQKVHALHEKAKQAGVAAITTTGIYPGVSNLMAAELVRLAQEEASPSLPKSLRYSYYTAGSGGAGPTILATSFLLLGEPVLAYKDGAPLSLPAYSNSREVDFGKGIRKKAVFLLNLPEVQSTHSVLQVPSVSARFGTDPPFWNWAMAIMAGVVPKELLSDREWVQRLVALTDPLVRAVDQWAGERMAIRVDLECGDGRKAVSLYSHRSLSQSVGQATAAFAMAVLEGSTQPGVWFPEEAGGVAVRSREKLLSRAAEGTIQFVTNRSPWLIEANPKNIGFGLYLD